MNAINIFVYVLTIFFFQNQDVQGLWITEDDETGKKKSEVLIYKEGNTVYGKIINLLLPEDKGKLCLKCKGENKNKPIEGLLILKDLILEEDTWEGGTILDPKSGKIYDCYISLEDNNTLKVRGFLGFSLLGRTQIWKRKLD